MSSHNACLAKSISLASIAFFLHIHVIQNNKAVGMNLPTSRSEFKSKPVMFHLKYLFPDGLKPVFHSLLEELLYYQRIFCYQPLMAWVVFCGLAYPYTNVLRPSGIDFPFTAASPT